jgi:CheY-like chemotaxis protein
MTAVVSETEETTVLLVDDNPQNLKVLYETLKDKGYRLLIANDGEKALDLAHRHQPEVILLDIMMPVASDDIHLDRCWSTNSPPFGWVNTLFHRKAECWSS